MKSSDISFVTKHPEAYREAGHDISYTPEVLYLDYWWNYKILSDIDVATYVTLQLFGKKSVKFSIKWLAKKSGCSVATLQQRFDNLENAELIEQIEPNRIILLTPKLSLEKDFSRLRKQVEENHVKKLRDLYGKRNKSIFQKIKSSVEIGLAK